MTANGWLQIVIFLALIFAVTKPMGVFMTQVFNRERTFMDSLLRPIERLIYRLTGVDENHEMRWTEYAFAMLLFSVVSMLLLYLIERVQATVPRQSQRSAYRARRRSRRVESHRPGVRGSGLSAFASFSSRERVRRGQLWRNEFRSHKSPVDRPCRGRRGTPTA
jgi:Potassium-transporting ATPase A subunit